MRVRTLTRPPPSAERASCSVLGLHAVEPEHHGQDDDQRADCEREGERRLVGPGWFAGSLLRILFGRTFLAAAENAPLRDGYKRVLAALPWSLHRAARASAHRRSIAHELGAIKAPTLVVSGEEDHPISPATARRVCAGILGARFRSFARTGHAVMIEQPQAFNAVLRDFLGAIA